MRTAIFKLVTLLLMSVLLIGLTGCDKEKTDGNEFCSCADIENFHKTAPSIDGYLAHVSKSKDWDDEQRLRALASWLRSKPCIIDAYLESVEYVEDRPFPTRKCTIGLPPGTYAKIAVLLNDNGTIRELTLNVQTDQTSKSEAMVATYYTYFTPREVVVRINSDITINEVFEFINSFEHDVPYLDKTYGSSMPTDSMQHILNNLKTKPYIKIGSWNNVYQIAIWITLSDMKNKEYQADWLETMSNYKLVEYNFSYHLYNICFQVPEGKEKEWKAKFEMSDLVNWADLNYEYRMMGNSVIFAGQ
jgi:hypothetical protein